MAKVFGNLHGVMNWVFTRAGYRWEVRRQGEQRIGLWRISLKRKSAQRKGRPHRLVVLPGFGDTPLSWFAPLMMIKPILSRKYDELVLVDFPGFHGFLSDEKCFESMDALIESTADLFDFLRPEAVLGHSLGAWLAAHYAADCGAGLRPKHGARHYTGPATVILANPPGVYGSDTEIEEWRQKFQNAITDGFDAFRPHLFASEPRWFKLFVSEFSGFMQREDTVAFMKSVRVDHNLHEKIGKTRAKVWLLWGEKDSLSLSSWVSRWMELLPGNAEALVIKRAGHCIQNESPGLTAFLLGQILLGIKPIRVGNPLWKYSSAVSGDAA